MGVQTNGDKLMATCKAGMTRKSWRAVAHGCALAASALLAACGGSGGSSVAPLTLSVLSSRPDYVSAGDALVKVSGAPAATTLSLFVNGSPQAATFTVDPADNKHVVL